MEHLVEVSFACNFDVPFRLMYVEAVESSHDAESFNIHGHFRVDMLNDRVACGCSGCGNRKIINLPKKEDFLTIDSATIEARFVSGR